MAEPKIDLDALAGTHVGTAIPPGPLVAALTSPPFIPTISMINLRDIGAVEGSAIKPGRIYRCGTLEATSNDPAAVQWLSTHVKKIFDLRREAERSGGPSPNLAGVENVWLDADLSGYKPPQLQDFAEGDGAGAWRKQLMSAAVIYRPVIKAILEHVRDHPEEPFLFHCTAGRDRTGVVAGLLQHLAGTTPEVVVKDYMLSRIGTEPAREKLSKFALSMVGSDDPETPGFYNLVSLRPEFYAAFLEGIQEEYGGWDGYVTKGLGMSEADLEKVKTNLKQ